MLKSLLLYGGILVGVFVLRFVLVAVVEKLENKLQKREKTSSPYILPFILATLVFLSSILIILQFAVPVLWIVSNWKIPSGILLFLTVMVVVFFGTHQLFKALENMTEYNTTKILNVVTAIVYILYIDWFIDYACFVFTDAFGFPDIVRAIMNVSLFLIYIVYTVVLLVKSFKSFK